MSFDISAVGDSPPVTPAGVPPGARAAGTLTEADRSEEPVTVDTIPSTPPPEVQQAIALAAQAHERLAASGREVRFAVDPGSGRVSVTVHDRAGNLLSTLAPSQALELAEGANLD